MNWLTHHALWLVAGGSLLFMTGSLVALFVEIRRSTIAEAELLKLKFEIISGRNLK